MELIQNLAGRAFGPQRGLRQVDALFRDNDGHTMIPAATVASLGLTGPADARLSAALESLGIRLQPWNDLPAPGTLTARDLPAAVAAAWPPGRPAQDLLRPIFSAVPGIPVFLMGQNQVRTEVLTALESGAFVYYREPYVAPRVAEALYGVAAGESEYGDVEVRIVAAGDGAHLRLRSKIVAAERVTQILRDIEADVPEEYREQAASALWEMLLNAIEHGSKGEPSAIIEVTYTRRAGELQYRITDPGGGFHPDWISHAARATDQADLSHLEVRRRRGMRPGGFGILIASRLVDELQYNEAGNEVLLIKKLPR